MEERHGCGDCGCGGREAAADAAEDLSAAKAHIAKLEAQCHSLEAQLDKVEEERAAAVVQSEALKDPKVVAFPTRSPGEWRAKAEKLQQELADARFWAAEAREVCSLLDASRVPNASGGPKGQRFLSAVERVRLVLNALGDMAAKAKGAELVDAEGKPL